MSKEQYYRQCTLVREDLEARTVLVTWIPEKADGVNIEPGVTMRVKQDRSDLYLPGRYRVESVGPIRQQESFVRNRAHMWTHYRGNTDV